MHSLDHFHHVFEGSLNILPKFLLAGIKGHLLFLNADVEESYLAVVLLHFLEEDSHGVVGYADQGFYHDVVD